MSSASGTVNASSQDPTQSVGLRRRFVRAFRRRWRELRGAIRDALDHSDRFGLSSGTALATQLAQFRRWLSGEIDDILVEPIPIEDVQAGRHWTAMYVRDAYEHGLRRADQALQNAGYSIPELAVAAAILRAWHKDKLRTAFVKAYQGVMDAGAAVEKDLAQTFADLRRSDISRRETADTLNERVTTVGPNSHTDALAHSVVVIAINRASLVRYRRAGVERVGVEVEETIAEGGVDVQASGPVTDDPRAVREGAPADPSKAVEWMTAGDSRVCPECRALAGQSWPLSAFATGDAPIPVLDTHPRCRCYLVPI